MITTLLEIGISNALVATALAAIALVVTRRMRPKFALAVWLLVLAKLLVPPLWTAPLDSLRTWAVPEAPPEPVTWTLDEPIEISSPEMAAGLPQVSRKAVLASEPPAIAADFEVSLPVAILSVWLAGSVLWTAVAAYRMRRFNRLLGNTRAAPVAILQETEVLSRQLGLRRGPEVRVTRRRTAPLVWSFGRRATILLPAELVTQLTRDELRALLLHELAHVRRRDHWTKVVELAAVAAYWWLPTAWLARRHADRATESCCDAEVVARLRSAPGSYATALVKTIDFLSSPTEPLPLGASGFSQFRHVSRRIEMILHPAPAARSLWRHRLALLAFAAAVLPLSIRSLWADPPPPAIESDASPPPSADEATTPTERAADPLPVPNDAERAAQYKADLEIEHVGPVEYEEEPNAKFSVPKDASKSAELNIAERLYYAHYAAKTNEFLKQYFGKKALQEAQAELARLEQKVSENWQWKMVAVRDQLQIHLVAMETKFAAGEVPVDELIDVQQQFAEREAALARAVCPRDWSGEILRMQANYMIACEALNRARQTWKTVHQRTQSGGAEPAAEALAREHFYRCKVQTQNVMQAAVGDFLQRVQQAGPERDMEIERVTARGAEWRMFAVEGPTTTGPQLGTLDPPSDEDVLKLLHRKLFEDGRSPVKGDIRLFQELRTTYVDEPRTYPEVGQAQRHHAIYKCTVGYVEQGGGQVVELVYIDHQHLHRMTEPPEQAAAATSPPQTAELVNGDAPEAAPATAGGEFAATAGREKDWNSSEAPMVDKQAFEAKTRDLANNMAFQRDMLQTTGKRRVAAAQQLSAVETAFEAGTVTIDQLLEARRRHAEAQLSYYNNLLPPETEENRLLLRQAHLIVIGESLNSARRTWQKIYAKYRTAAAGGEPAIEAQAREQFYQFKSEYERARSDYQDELDRRTSSKQKPTSQSSEQSVREREKSFQAELNRVSIAGPVTTGDDVKPLDPPSDDEVVHALANQNSKAFRSLHGENHRIVKELVATYTDPPKWHPKLFGKGQLHHAHYKCTFYYDDPQGKPQNVVVFVDHNHLHRKADSRSFDEFQSGHMHYTIAKGITKETVQFRHHQLQLARQKVKLADLGKEAGNARTAEQDAELARLNQDIAARQHKLDVAARRVLQFAINPTRPAQKK